MLHHYLKIAWRNIRQHKLYTAINVLGLAMGICACIVIYLIARYDLSFDTFHPDAGRIYRIVGDAKDRDGGTLFLNSPIDEMAGVEHDVPGFEAQTIFHTFGERITIPATGGKQAADFDGRLEDSYSARTILTAPSFFSIFPHEWLAGSPAVLDAPDRVVLAESSARRYFGKGPLAQMIGRTVIYADSLPVTVAGIVKDWNKLSDLGYTDFISLQTAPTTWLRSQIPTADWVSLRPHRSQAFVKLAPGVDPATVNAALAKYMRDHHVVFGGGQGSAQEYPHYYLQPLRAIHYTPDFRPTDSGDDFRKAYLPMLYALMGVAVFILALAVINFINLSTAQSLQRMKEVGIRKVMGSSRKGLIVQFLAETLLLTVAAVALSLFLVRPVLSLFREYIPAGVEFRPWEAGNLMFVLLITLVTTMLAGFYPARLLSGYLPVLSLKGALDRTGTGGAGLRKALIVFQFTISLVFIIGSLVIARQTRFMRDADKGFSSDAILTVTNWRAGKGQMRMYAEEVKKLAGVENAIVEGNAPMGFAHSGGNFVYRGAGAGTGTGAGARTRTGAGAGKDTALKDMGVTIQGGDMAFIPFYGMRLVAGRNMGQGDSLREVVINEAYSRALGFDQPGEAVGKLVYNNKNAYMVAGVVADFHQDSYHETIKPLVIERNTRLEQQVAVKLATKGQQGSDAKLLVGEMEGIWKKLFPKEDFEYDFMNESISRLYEQETHTAWLMEVAMSVTILISCMGLFGLALFTAGRRAKEIGIRKVLGATVANITLLLSRDFLVLVGLAIVIALPVAWYFADQWLEDYAFRAPMNVWVIVEAGLAAIGIALVTVSVQALQAALANPVNSLRSE
jgi:putative ABC transport system permease protein